MNSLVLTNIQNSNYFKYQLYDLHTYHQVVEEITKKVGREWGLGVGHGHVTMHGDRDDHTFVSWV